MKLSKLYILKIGASILLIVLAVFLGRELWQFKTIYGYEHKTYRELIKTKGPGFVIEKVRSDFNDGTISLNACHRVLHDVGDVSWHQYQDLSYLMQYNIALCTGGFFHGMMQGFAATTKDTDLKVILSLCHNDPEHPYLTTLCFHGLGHAFMLYENYKLAAALKHCDKFSGQKIDEDCYSGVFMELAVSDHTKHDQDPFMMCHDEPIKYKRACYFYVPHYLSSQGYNLESILKQCSRSDKPHDETCSRSLGTLAIIQYFVKPKKAEAICIGNESSQVRPCVEGIATFYMNFTQDKAKGERLCASLSQNVRGYCLGKVKNWSTLF